MKMPITTVFRRQALALLFSAVSLAGVGQLRAQNAVSNFGLGSIFNNFSVGKGPEIRQLVFSFTTGASVAGFDFTGVTVDFSTPNDPATGLTFGLYDSFSIGAGEGSLVSNLSLVGSTQPTTAGQFSFSGSATLAQNTTYFLKFAADTTAANTAYFVRATNSTSETGLAGWSIGDLAYVNVSGTWSAVGGTSKAAIFSVQASAIPEPSTYAAIAGAAMLGLAVWQRRRRTSPVATPLVTS